ncbi:MAG: GBS Bsp-like repeat-containing protein, partial [Lachnospiraceae bacterium]|nr:GBS Bsp-like repeat-containing protein [Lachnospiraceae bacterium]
MKTQKILMKMLALMQTVFMLVTHVVWAEGDTGSTPAETAEATSTADDEEATPENGENDPETDPEADPDSEPAQGRSLPQESADEESDADNEISGEAPAGALRGAGAEEGEEESEPEPEPPLKIEDSDGKQLSFTATLTDYEMPDDGADVRIAIWSVKGCQDDLRWSIMQKNEEGRYSFTCNLKNHKTEGEYRIHT